MSRYGLELHCPFMVGRMRVPATHLGALLAALAITAMTWSTSAQGAVPGANGQLTYSGSAGLTFLNSTTGVQERPQYQPPQQPDGLRPTLTSPRGSEGPLFTSPDTRHVAMNSRHRTYGDASGNIYWDQGANLGSIEDLGGTFTSTPVFPDFFRTPQMCNADADVVAALADGTFLWRRWFNDYTFTACNYANRAEHTDFTITDETGRSTRRVFDSTQGLKMPGTVFAETADPSVVLSWANGGGTESAPAGIYRIHLDTQTSERLTTTLPFAPTDASPNGRYVVGVQSATSPIQLQRLDVQTGEVKTLIDGIQASAVEPIGQVGSYAGITSAVVSPDGTQVAFHRMQANDRGGRDAIVAMGIDGSSPRVVRLADPMEFISANTLNWAPGKAFEVDLSGDKLIGDTVEIDVKTTNLLDQPLTGLTWTDGGVPGLRLNNAPFEQKLQPSLLGGPTPGLVTDLGAKASGSHQYLLGIDMPGRLYVRADVAGGPAGKTPSAVRSNVLTIDASSRPLEQWEKFMAFTNGYGFMADLAQATTNRAITDTLKQVETMTKGFGASSPATRKSRATLTSAERALARSFGLPDDTFKWLPESPKQLLAMKRAFGEGQQRALEKTVVDWAKVKGEKVRYAGQFWSNQIWGSDSTYIPVSEELYKAGAEKYAKAEGYVKQARNLLEGPDASRKMQLFLNDQSYKLSARLDIGARNLMAAGTRGAKDFARLMNDDPAAASEKLGGWVGVAKGNATTAFIDNAIEPSGENIFKWAKSGGSLLRKIGVPDIDFSAPSSSKLDDLAGDLADLVPADADALGMGKQDQLTVASIAKELEDEARALGYDIDLALSFRARNLHSTDVKDGVGKIGLFTTKTGTLTDVQLGMDRRALGKGVIYKPQLPPAKEFNKLGDAERHALIQRHAEMLEQYRAYQKPGSPARKAATKGGTVYENKFKGQTTMRAEVKTKEKYFGETIALQYEKLIVDGRTIVDPKKAARWMISDFDGNAILSAKGGKNLPAGIRATIEQRLNRKLIAAAESKGFAYGFHGFTYNGSDVETDKHRKLVKYLLESLDGPERKVMIDQYLKKYGLSDYQQLLESYESGQYVIRVTRDGATAATGF